jgi:hypothetical protein
MKKFIKILMFSAAVFAGVCVFNSASAQPPATPSTGGNNPGDRPMGGGTAPIGSGMLFLIAMGAGYAVKKAYANKATE